MKKEMLINVLQPEECRIAIVEDGVLEELYVERASQESYVGNIYKGKIVNIEVGVGAVFVDFGIGRNGFLHFTDVDPVYYKHLLPPEMLEELDDDDRRPPRGGGGGPRNGSGGGGRGDRPRDPETAAPPRGRGPAPRPARVEPEDDDFGDGMPNTGTGFAPPEPDDADGFAPPMTDEFDAPPFDADPVPLTAVPPPPPKRPTAPPVYIPVTQPAAPTYATEEDFAGFDEGLDLDTPPHLPAVRAPISVEPPPLPEPEVQAESVAGFDTLVRLEETTTGDEPGDEDADDGKPKAKGRAKPGTRKAKPKADDEEKPKAKPRRGKKKSDDGDDDKPIPMESAESRSTPSDDPESEPFFDGGDEDFDPNAPNDRFADGDGDDDNEDGDDDENGDEANADDAKLDADLAAIHRKQGEEDFDGGGRGGRGGGGGRGGDRGRGGPGGGRGGPGGPGGGRGGPGGFGGGNGGGGGRGGPPRGGPAGKAHTRHKGLPIPPIQEIFKRGQEVIVQVIKEGIGTKGPTLSTFISIAGRYLVLMPSLGRVGVSKKIEDRDARHRLRDVMNKMNPPKGVGFIVRTAAIDRDETELQNDLAYLLRLWQVVVRRIKRVAAPVEIYRESDMITRTIRDIFTADIDTIWVDEERAFAHASEFLQIVMPKYASRIRYHGDAEPLFHRYRVEEEIAKINHKRLDLPGGGSIIIEQTEALVAIDVNSGNFRAEGNMEETAYQMNLRAAKEIARQLRLRDLGGVIVNDFIDMRHETHRRSVEDALRTALKRDRARTKILRISEFGIIEMTRQRMQPSLKKRVYSDCSHCGATGFVKTHETMGIEVMRNLQLAANRSPNLSLVVVVVHSDVAFHLLNKKRKELAALEASAGLEIRIEGRFGVSPDLHETKCYDQNGLEVKLNAGPPPRAGRTGPPPRGGGRYGD